MSPIQSYRKRPVPFIWTNGRLTGSGRTPTRTASAGPSPPTFASLASPWLHRRWKVGFHIQGYHQSLLAKLVSAPRALSEADFLGVFGLGGDERASLAALESKMPASPFLNRSADVEAALAKALDGEQS